MWEWQKCNQSGRVQASTELRRRRKASPKLLGVVVGSQEQLRQAPLVVASQTILGKVDLDSKRRTQLLWPPGGGRTPLKGAPGWLMVSLCLACSSVLPCISSGSVTEEPHRYTRLGWVKGKQVTVLGTPKPVDVFLGIPFAAPPLGDLRFSNPQPASPWHDLREATTYPNL